MGQHASGQVAINGGVDVAVRPGPRTVMKPGSRWQPSGDTVMEPGLSEDVARRRQTGISIDAMPPPGLQNVNPSTPKRVKARAVAEEKLSEPRPLRVHKAHSGQSDVVHDPICKSKNKATELSSVIANALESASAARLNIARLDGYLEARRCEATAAAKVAEAALAAGFARQRKAELEGYLEVRRADAEVARIACQELAQEAHIDRHSSAVVKQLHWSVEAAAAEAEEEEGEDDDTAEERYWSLADDSMLYEYVQRNPLEDACGDVEEPVCWEGRRLQCSSHCHGLSGVLHPSSPKRRRYLSVQAGTGKTTDSPGKRRRRHSL